MAFSMSEMAIVSARKVRLQHQANHAKARAALELAVAPNRFLSTVRWDFAHRHPRAFGGATLADKLAFYLRPIPGWHRIAK